MKKFFMVGLTQCFCSFIPILIWTMMGKFHGEDFANGMMYTYPYQFIFMSLGNIAVIGNIKYEMKHSLGEDYGKSGSLIFLLSCVFMISLSMICFNPISAYLGIKGYVGKWSYLFGLVSMTVDWSAYYIGLSCQYHGKIKKGMRIIGVWYAGKLLLVLFTALPVFDCRSTSLFILIAQSAALLFIYLKISEIKKFRFSLKNGIRYSISGITGNLFMALIYLFGVHEMSSHDIGFLAAYNLMTLCTDAQWDMLGEAVDVVATGYVCDGLYKKKEKRIFFESMMFAFILVVSSFVMMCGMILLYPNVDARIAFLCMAIELSVMIIPDAAIYVMEGYLAVQKPGIWLGILSVAKKVSG